MKKLLVFAIGSFCAISAVQAQTRFYDTEGGYQGRMEWGNGGYRFYDTEGAYRGRADSDQNGGFRYYDPEGAYLGRSEGQ